jgi:ubiquinone biosynthesis protein
MRESLTRLLEAVVKGDARAATEAYLEMVSASEKVNRAGLLVDIKAVIYEIHRSDLADVSVGAAFDSLLRAGSRHGVHNPGEFFLLTRAFVILESMIRELDPHHNYMESFREEISRLTAKHFSVERIKEKTTKLARDLERLISDAPSDTRRFLRRIAEGNLGRLQVPAVEALGGSINRNLKRLTDAIAAAALLIGGSMLASAQPDTGWRYYFGEVLVAAGVIATFLVGIAALRSDQGRGRGRR